MSDHDPQPGDRDPAADPADRRDAAARSGDLQRMAAEAADATWGDQDSPKPRVPGVFSGDVGPKGQVSAQLRERSRSERERYGEVPPGTVASRGGLLVLLPMLGIALLLLGIVVLLGWLLS